MKPGRVLVVLVMGACLPATAAQVSFDLLGRAGPGLLGGNENQASAVAGGSGGELGNGIVFDDVSNLLSIDVGWGSVNGFSDMTGLVTAGHIHGSTTGVPGGTPDAFLQNASVLIGLNALPGFDGSATEGGFTGSVSLNDAQEAALLEGRLYLNFHTGRFPGGEIRGQLIRVPEPATLALALVSLGLVAGMGRRRKAT